MRPTRLLLALTSSLLLVTLLLHVTPSRSAASSPPIPAAKKKSGISAFFSFHTPLFPPSAIISLTDDNSTFFLARPAAFGPKLPSSGLSGQLWIGSGFGEDNLGSGGRTEGELGCSDVPGWDESMGKPAPSSRDKSGSLKFVVKGAKENQKSSKNARRATNEEAEVEASDTVVAKAGVDDGTDEHLYHAPHDIGSVKDSASKNGKGHADIQSLQESAEIYGKVVLLSRGGCGFLEKVKWVQRRGGKALIVGDDIRGGPLVTMYAHGDTSNITVPALFTSYTTAHLLSSLIPSGGVFGSLPLDGNKAGLKGKSKSQDGDDKLTYASSSATIKSANGEQATLSTKEESKPKHGWFRRFIMWIVGTDDDSVSTRPPGSGSVSWVQVEQFEDDKPKKTKEQMLDEPASPASNNFVIGVHDWRDPDMVPAKAHENVANQQDQQKGAPPSSSSSSSSNLGQLKGGIITPGSGEYEHPKASEHSENKQDIKVKSEVVDVKGADGWLNKLPWKHDGADENAPIYDATLCVGDQCSSAEKTDAVNTAKQLDAPPKHEGLWVTLTPTTMSSSPFFDTLLVLVVSPLVTLTIVYAMLLLRSRIRRRRWRAPKSVVDRLPVRTYHTIASEASTTSIATPNASSPTTPLLQPAPRRIASRSSSRSRPRSRTTSEVPAGSSSLVEHSTSPATVEKREAGLAEWRRKYGGRQRECVVCLEEYVDGVSRVMSLPCGHEFHAECITPWLTTRRRTCPICKGDVVRSMQRGTLSRQNSSDDRASLGPISTLDDQDEEEVQARAANTRNDSPSAALPMNEHDLERGLQRHRTEPNASEASSWREWAINLLAPAPQPSRGREEADRNR